MKITGGCHCGNIKYEAEAEPANAMICHCTDCQLLSGSAFRTLIVTDEDAFNFTSGKPKTYVKVADSGNKREQTFCPDCGSPIYSASVGASPREYAIRLGTVDQREALEPQKQIWCNSAHSWIKNMTRWPAQNNE